MSTMKHEILIDMVRQRPALVAELIANDKEVRLPRFRQATLLPNDFTDVAPTEYRADQVVALYGEDGEPELALVFEVQRSEDRRKRYSWPVYVTTVRARMECPAALVVFCFDEKMARWCSSPINLGKPDFVLRPSVVWPDTVPYLNPDDAHKNPEMALLSALGHGRGENPEPALEGAVRACAGMSREQAKLYTDLLWSELPEAGKRCLERIMVIAAEQGNEFAGYFATTFARGKAEGEARGEARGEAKAILTILTARHVDVSGQDRDRIASCQDIEQLEKWVVSALTATSVQDLFAL